MKLGLITTLGLLFIGLKLGGVISWSWWWVLCPFWFGWSLLFAFVFIIIVLGIIETIIDK